MDAYYVVIPGGRVIFGQLKDDVWGPFESIVIARKFIVEGHCYQAKIVRVIEEGIVETSKKWKVT